MWASDAVNGSLAELDWPVLENEFEKLDPTWTELVIGHAKAENGFFQTSREIQTHDIAEGEDEEEGYPR